MRLRTRDLMIVGAGGALLAAGTATAAVTATRDAAAAGNAVADTTGLVTGAAFEQLPPNGNPVAISTSSISEFPTSGDRFLIISTGNATDVQNPTPAWPPAPSWEARCSAAPAT